MGWELLDLWGPNRVVQELSGGVRNDVRMVELDGKRAVARLGERADADLAWETGLLRHLDAAGLAIPRLIPARDGRFFVDGLTVMEVVTGRHPESEDDWKLAAAYLRRLHQLTPGWTQRPGWTSSIDLLTRDTGTSIDLTVMPAEAVSRCRAAWAPLVDCEPVVIHGDPNPNNVFIDDGRVVLIDWDEARVDLPHLDLALPFNAAGLVDDEYQTAMRASSAWEAAVCWQAEPDYAQLRLNQLPA